MRGRQPPNRPRCTAISQRNAVAKRRLKPEKSTQFTFGARVDPLKNLSLGLDYWNVHIKDQIQSAGISEQTAFGIAINIELQLPDTGIELCFDLRMPVIERRGSLRILFPQHRHLARRKPCVIAVVSPDELNLIHSQRPLRTARSAN